MNPPTSLNSLPTELILQIAETLAPTVHDLASLLRTCRCFAVWLSPILVRCGVHTRDPCNGRSVLHWAVATGRDSLLRSLLAHGADVNTEDDGRNGPLHSAVLRASTVMVTRLLEHGADVGRRNVSGWAALDLAAIMGNREIAGVLLEHGAKMVARSDGLLGSTPFHYAVMHRHVGVTELFLAHGGDLDATDRSTTSVRQKAAIVLSGNGDAEEPMVKLLFGTVEVAREVAGTHAIAIRRELVAAEIDRTRMFMEVLEAWEECTAQFPRTAGEGDMHHLVAMMGQGS